MQKRKARDCELRAFWVLGYLQMGHYTGNRPGAATAPIFDRPTSSAQQRKAERDAQRKAFLARQIAETQKANPIIQDAVAACGLSNEERERFVQQAQRSARAKAAQKIGQRTPKPKRAKAAAPQKSRMFIPDMAADAFRDARLSNGAKACLGLIHALAKQRQPVSRAGLAALLNKSIRQVQRYLAELDAYGYIVRELVHSISGWITGQIISITSKVLPFFLRPRHRNGGIPVVTEMSPINCLSAVNPLYPHFPSSSVCANERIFKKG